MNADAVMVDNDGLILYANNVLSDMTGVPLERLIGSSLESLVMPEDMPLFLTFMTGCGAEKRTTEEIRIVGHDNELFVRLAGSSQTTNGMKKTYIVITDASDLKSAEKSRLRAYDKLSTPVVHRFLFGHDLAHTHQTKLGLPS